MSRIDDDSAHTSFEAVSYVWSGWAGLGGDGRSLSALLLRLVDVLDSLPPSHGDVVGNL